MESEVYELVCERFLFFLLVILELLGPDEASSLLLISYVIAHSIFYYFAVAGLVIGIGAGRQQRFLLLRSGDYFICSLS